MRSMTLRLLAMFRESRCAMTAPLRHVMAMVLLATSGVAHAQEFAIAVSRSPLSLPLYVAEVAGYFQDEGLKVRFTECVGGHRCLKLMLDGQVDVATAGDTPVMFNSFERSDFAVVGTIASTTDDLKLYVRPEAGIARPRDLSGKRVGVVIGTASQYFLDSLLMIHGVDPRQIQPVPMQPEAMLEALQSKRVDAVSVWEPYGYRISNALKGAVVTIPNAGVYSAVFNLVVQRRLVGTRDADLVKLLTAVDRAESLIRDDPARAKQILRQRLATDDDFVRWVWPGLLFRLSLDQSLLKTLESEARWALREGHVTDRSAPNFLPYLHRGPLMQVRPEAVGINR
jgi:NitT/TauT family transport system substrate-binding protein